ncbi:MAG: endolytic transglycosylase MltG [Lachnospiraceae bacterium]|nr:endolytic transglycosylase MltG [Lachnospiraceae bacterium]
MNAKQLLGAISAMIIKTAAAVVIIIVVFRLAVGAYDFGYQVFADLPVSEGEGRIVSVVVKEGQSCRELAKELEEKGLINNSYVFFIQEHFSDYKDMIQPGTYELSTAMNSEQMLEVLCHVEEEEDQ